MKTIKNILLALVMLLLVTACDSLLDFEPQDNFGGTNFWQKKEQVQSYIVGLHNQVRAKAWNYYKFGEERGGWLKYGTSSSDIDMEDLQIKTQALTEQNANTESWDGFYDPIMQINELIYKLEKEIDFLSKEDADYFLGQAYGLRAFMYFHLYRTYGGVPVVTEPKVVNGVNNPKDLYVARSTPAATLAFIKADIDKSVSCFEKDNFTIQAKRTIWGKAASYMLQAEVYLWGAKVATGDYTPDAKDLEVADKALDAVVACPSYSLSQPYDKLFLFENKGNDEIIWALNYGENEETNFYYKFTYNNMFYNRFYDKDGNLLTDPLDLRNSGVQRHEYKYELFVLYDDADVRKRTNFLDFYDAADPAEATLKGVIFRKFMGMINAGGKRLFVDDIPVYRYADALLMKAEIANAQGQDPSSYMNEIRRRAYGDGYPPFISKSKVENEKAIYIERLKEFAGEGKSWYDARRMYGVGDKPLVYDLGLLDEAKEAYKLLWPVDINVLNNDPEVEQTPGYVGT